MAKYTDDELRAFSKITCKIAGEYLGISSMAVSIGMRNGLLPIGFAVHNEERDRRFSESWSYHIVAERLDALFKAIEKLGGEINQDLSMKIRNDIVHVN